MSAAPISSEAVTRAARLIESADALVIAAGAGMGVDSGLPDFRGKDGFWRAYPALARANLPFEEVASPQTFERDPALAWGFYGHRLALYRSTVPHAGFHILRRWAEAMHFGANVFTSNVDGHFQRAGFASEDVHECHGSIHHLQCLEPCSRDIWDAESFMPDVDAAACRLTNAPPRCPACGALARPNILMFNDWGWLAQRSRAQAARQTAWLAAVERPVVIELGAGSAIPSVRLFSQQLLHAHGARLIRINPREHAVPTSRDVGIASGALAALMAIDRALTDQSAPP